MKRFFFRAFDYLISRVLILLDIIFRKVFNWYQFLPRLHDKIQTKQYYTKKIDNKKIRFFCPSATTLYRIETLFTKEPETLSWINNFQEYNSNKITFWDIGANIGIYSIYAAIKFENIEIISFEPSTSNTRTLSRNISINNLYDKIKIFPLALCDKKNIMSFFNETTFAEGGSMSTFNSNIDEVGNILDRNKIQNKYSIFGTSIDDFIANSIIDCPTYIKIDVDGIEHLILKGAQHLLGNIKLRELAIEMNPNYSEQYKSINKLMEENGFKKHIHTNSKLLKNIDIKLKSNGPINTVFKRTT